METIKLSTIKPNPNNPRIMTRQQLDKLMDSISSFKKMMSLRPIVIDEHKTVLGGNQRLLALKALKYKEVPKEWIKQAKNLTEQEKKQFIIADNISFGDWDSELLQTDWDLSELESFGLQMNELVFQIEQDKPEKPKAEKLPDDPITCPNCGVCIDVQ